MSKKSQKSGKFQGFRQKLIRLRRIVAFVMLASEDRCRVATLFSNSHLFFENEPQKRNEYNALNRDFECWWRFKNTVKQFIKKRLANW